MKFVVSIYQNAKGDYRARCRHCHGGKGPSGGPFESFEEAKAWARVHEASSFHQDRRAKWLEKQQLVDSIVEGLME